MLQKSPNKLFGQPNNFEMLTTNGTPALTGGLKSLTSLAYRTSTLGYSCGEEVGGPQDSKSLINKINVNGKRQSASRPNTNQSDVINRAKEIMWQEKTGLGHRCTTKWGIREMKVDRVCPVQSGDWLLNLSDVSSQVVGELVCLGEIFSSNSCLPWVWFHVHQTMFRGMISLAVSLIPGRRMF